ncbi:MAG: phenylalanine--tRNA ligase subunit beta [candidate division WOR-3 bacterium]
MRVLYNDIKNLIENFNLSPYQLKELFENIGIEVENFIDLSEGLKDKVFAGIVKDLKLDGNLKILKVWTKVGEFQIITTAQVNINDKVVLALEGTKLKNGEEIRKKYIKSYLSEGMLLSEEEIGISDISDRVIILPSDFDLNEDVLNYLQLNDYLYELYIFPNRGDLMGLLGICYEIASYLNLSVKDIEMIKKENFEDVNFPIEIENNEGCFRYVGRIIKNVNVSDSPSYLRYKLYLLGFRSINNIVDITNYVMWEIGQPLHAFDLERINEKIIVRNARDGETIKCLDNVERKLSSEILVIADKYKPVAIAGIIGGEESAISNDTKHILLESAYFNKSYISRASRMLKLKTESSKRFEKGLNWEFVEIASKRASYLISKIANGILFNAIDVYKNKIEKKKIKVYLENVNKLLGLNLNQIEFDNILNRIGIKKIENEYEIPYHRDDLENYYDIAEEVCKHIGIENIPSNYEAKIIANISKIKKNVYENAINFLFPRGYYEAKTLSLISEQKAKVFYDNYLKISNPISLDMSVYRSYIISSLLDSLSINIRRNGYGLKLMEFGNVFRENKEFESLGIVVGGKKVKSYFEKEEYYSIYELKGDVEVLLNYLNYNYEFKISQRAFLRTCLDIYSDSKLIGFLGELKRSVLKLYDIKFPVYVCEIELDEIKPSYYEEFSKFPKIEKDISILLKKSEYYINLENQLKSLNVPYLYDFYLIDVYEGPSIDKDYRSFTFRLVFLSKERTLRDEEVNEIFMDIINKIEQMGYKVRRI